MNKDKKTITETKTIDVKTIPIPSRSKYPWKTIEVAQSFFVPVPDGRDLDGFMKQMRIQAVRAGGKYNRRFTTRSVHEHGKDGIRIWRTA